MSKAQEPLAYLVTGGRMYLDRAFTSKTHAETSVSERKDGAAIVPLYTAPASSEQQAAQQDAELVEHVIDAARNAMDASIDVMDDFTIESHLVAALSLALDELDAARASNGGKA